jgi:opacity protein-like surface antigen
MKNIKLSLITIIGLGTVIHAGGDISPITPYETEDMEMATEYATQVEITPTTPKTVASVPPVVVPLVAKSKQKETEPKKEIESKKETEPKKETTHNSRAYIGLGGVVAQYDTNCKCPNQTLSGTDKTGGAILKVGYEYNQYIGIEARGIKTMIKEDGGEIEHIGVLVKPSYPVSKNTNLYGLVGWAKTTTSGSLRKTDVDGLAFGAGMDYTVSENISLFADYERLFQKSDAPKLDAVSVGANYRF